MRAVDIYRALLWCYPAQFRHEYGREMVGAFSADLVQARHEAGRRASAAVWIRTLVDLLPTAFREHRHVIQQDLRHAIRILAASRGFTAVAVLSLALGIGANTAIFSLLNSVLLQTLPVPHPETLVMLTDPDSSGVSVGQEGGERSLMTYTEFRQLQDQATTVTPLLASQSSLARTPARIAGGEPEDIGIRLVSASYFQTLAVPAVLGRTFDAAREPDPGAAPYAVLSFEYLAAAIRREARRAGPADRVPQRRRDCHRRDAVALLRRDRGRSARRVDSAGHAGGGDTRSRLAARPAWQCREGDVAARVRPPAAGCLT